MSTYLTQPLDEQVKQITTASYNGTRRDMAVAAEANQILVEYIDWLKDNLPVLDEPIVVGIGGTQIRFNNDEDFADWLSEMLA